MKMRKHRKLHCISAYVNIVLHHTGEESEIVVQHLERPQVVFARPKDHHKPYHWIDVRIPITPDGDLWGTDQGYVDRPSALALIRATVESTEQFFEKIVEENDGRTDFLFKHRMMNVGPAMLTPKRERNKL